MQEVILNDSLTLLINIKSTIYDCLLINRSVFAIRLCAEYELVYWLQTKKQNYIMETNKRDEAVSEWTELNWIELNWNTLFFF